jgi:hypothetical protein
MTASVLDLKQKLADSVRMIGQGRKKEREAVVRFLTLEGQHDLARMISEGEHVK